MTVLVVSGTGTGVGKTVVTAAVAALAAAQGQRVALVKPAQTGVLPGEPGDLDVAARLSGVEDLHELGRYPEPLAPATAARRCGIAAVTTAEVHTIVQDLAARCDLVLIEGAGGLLVHLDASMGTLVDIAASLGAKVLIVTSAGLGALNAVALTTEALRRHTVTCAGVVIGSWPDRPDLASWCNVNDFECYAQAPLLGALPEGAALLARDDFCRIARQSLAAELGGEWNPRQFREAAHAAVPARSL